MPFARVSRVGAWSALLAGGVIAVLAVAGCGSGSPSSPAAATTSSPAATAAPLPSWASALGGGVTVVAPRPASPGYGSPGAVVQGFVAAISSKHYADSCVYGEPGAQATCRSETSRLAAGQLPYDSNFALGYVVIDGNKAAVGMTGTFCSPGQSPECFTNDDPSAVFSTAKSFGALWANAITPSSRYSLTPCVEIDGKWYIYASS